MFDTVKLKPNNPPPPAAQHMEHWQLITSGVAHDFNNLLTIILGQTSLALRQLPEDASARRHIEKAIRAVEHATTLSDQLLTYSKGCQGQTERIHLNSLVQDNFNLLDSSFLDDIELILELAPGIPPIQARYGQLQQVVMNLLINAAEAIHPNNGRITVRTGIQPFFEDGYGHSSQNGRFASNDAVYIQVQDTGIGMDADTLNHIFDPFFTTKPTGRGLGLSAINDIVQSHQGRITVSSQKGQGTIFTVFFPCDPPQRLAQFPLQ